VNSKERLLTALRCGTPDRVPISCYDLDGTLLKDSWERRQPSFIRLSDYIAKHCDLFQPALLSYKWPYMLKNEIIITKRKENSLFLTITLKTPKGDLTQRKQWDNETNNYWALEHFIKTDSDLEKYTSVDFTVEKPDFSEILEKERILGDRGVVSLSIADAISIPAAIMDYSDFVLKVTTDYTSIKPLIDKMHEQTVFLIKEFIKAMKGHNIAVRLVGPKLVTPPNVSPEIFHKVICEYDSVYIKLLKEAGIPVRIHCQGKTSKLLSHFLEMGADAVDPFEPLPQGDISLVDAKKVLGGKICVCGGMQYADFETCSPDQIEEKVKVCMDQAKAGGGYIILPSSTPITAPLTERLEQNYYAFIESAIKYGQY